MKCLVRVCSWRIAAADVAAAQNRRSAPAVPISGILASFVLVYLLDLIEMRAFISHRLPRFYWVFALALERDANLEASVPGTEVTLIWPRHF